MNSDDYRRVMFLDARFSVLELSLRCGRPHVRYIDVVTGWRGDVAQFRSRAAAAAFDEAMASDDTRGEAVRTPGRPSAPKTE
jgi:hypothetical protein